MSNSTNTIRQECLQPFSPSWTVPTGQEVAEALKLAGFSCSVAAKELNLKKNGARTIRKWMNNETNIPHKLWIQLCHHAGLIR
ncbi:transcriptional regulator [Methylomonas koyamae]|nr:transcriptional regulator [Methylomonas koyamae]